MMHLYMEDKEDEFVCAVLGKVEGEDKLWHGHVTAVTVAPQCRRLGLASKLMKLLEETTEKMCHLSDACCPGGSWPS